jgi:hypothetical protein
MGLALKFWSSPCSRIRENSDFSRYSIGLRDVRFDRQTGEQPQGEVAVCQFSVALYQGDSNWIPPLRGNQLELLNYKPHPFYEYSQIQTFVALRGGEACGRIAAIINQAHNQRHQEQRGFFGFFECIDDQQVADACSMRRATG